ncbi:MAG: hypothetical protein KC635_22940 [Myxococcales bacterium]|nr:hypothetical protein [Myxococcales bacterium]MCB9734994.1 hypothetical protein [Deltaproteobacteria bacterium]
MMVLFVGAGLTILGTFLMVHAQIRQGRKFAQIAAEADPLSRRVPRPAQG